MSLRFVSRKIQFYPGSEPKFVIYTAQHTDGAWVRAIDSYRGDPPKSYQQIFYDLAVDANNNGWPIEIVCESYSEHEGDRRFYNSVEAVFQLRNGVGPDNDPASYAEIWPKIRR